MESPFNFSSHDKPRDRQLIVHSEVALVDRQAIEDFEVRVQQEAELFQKRLNGAMKAIGRENVTYSVEVGLPVENLQAGEPDHWYVVIKGTPDMAVEAEPAPAPAVELDTLNYEARPIIAIEYDGVLDEENLTDDMLDFIHEALNTHEVAVVAEAPEDLDRRFDKRNRIWRLVHDRCATPVSVGSHYLTAWTAIPEMADLIVSTRVMHYQGTPPNIRKLRAA